MRLFIALDIDDSVRERIARFLDGVRNFAPEARWVKEESLHVTLKFVGEQPDDKVDEIQKALSGVRASPCEIRFRGYGFFPTAKLARVFWIGMEAGPELAALAGDVDGTMATYGIPKEERKFSPHLTLARAPGGSGAPRRLSGDRPNRVFDHLQQKLANLPSPEFGTMTAHEFYLYRSQLSPKGANYTKLARFGLNA